MSASSASGFEILKEEARLNLSRTRFIDSGTIRNSLNTLANRELSPERVSMPFKYDPRRWAPPINVIEETVIFDAGKKIIGKPSQ